MAVVPFKVSLIDPSTNVPALILSDDCVNINITDESNYGATGQVGYTPLSRFADYRKIIVTHQSGKFFTMSSLPGADQLIDPAASGNNTFAYKISFGDGVYAFRLISVPTWNSGDNYQNSFPLVGFDVVYNAADGKLYKNIVPSAGANLNHQPDLSPAFWTVTTDADVPGNLSDTQKISVFCAANVCWMKKVVAANCKVADGSCNTDDLCSNKDLLASVMVRNLVDEIVWASNKGDFDSAEIAFTTLQTICPC